MIKVISFDLDGTLADENFDKLIWFEEIPRLFAERYKIPVEEAKQKVFAEYDSKNEHYQWTDITYWFQSFGLEGHKKLLDDMKHHIKMFPDAVPAIKELSKRYKLIIVTSSEKNFLDLKLKVDGIGGFFSCVFSMPNDFKKLKKDESAYKNIIERLDIKPEEIIHVGDNYNSDYLTPKKAGINSFFLDRAKEKSGKDIVHDLSEFTKKIMELK